VNGLKGKRSIQRERISGRPNEVGTATGSLPGRFKHLGEATFQDFPLVTGIQRSIYDCCIPDTIYWFFYQKVTSKTDFSTVVDTADYSSPVKNCATKVRVFPSTLNEG
jgi:hypothetical protein